MHQLDMDREMDTVPAVVSSHDMAMQIGTLYELCNSYKPTYASRRRMRRAVGRLDAGISELQGRFTTMAVANARLVLQVEELRKRCEELQDLRTPTLTKCQADALAAEPMHSVASAPPLSALQDAEGHEEADALPPPAGPEDEKPPVVEED